MEEIEITAKSVEEATREAEERLGIGRDEFDTVIVKEGKSGIFKGEEAVIRVKPRMSQLPDSLTKEEQGEGENVIGVATGVIEKLFGLMGLEGTIEASSDGTSISIDIDGDDLGILIGRQGQTLSCLQYIIRLIVGGQLKAWLPLNVDVCGYRKRRYESLQKLALSLAEQVTLRRRSMTMEPMPPDERRIIHLALAAHPDVITCSTGEGEDRKLVISLR